MKYYMVADDTYIYAFGGGEIEASGEEITEEAYLALVEAVRVRPRRTDSTDYKLTRNLTWEPYPVDPPTDEVDAEEALEIIMGGDSE